MPHEVVRQCGVSSLKITKYICATSPDNAKKILQKLFNQEADKRCTESVCPDEGKNCKSHHIIDYKSDVKECDCCDDDDCPEDMHLYKCTASARVDCICR